MKNATVDTPTHPPTTAAAGGGDAPDAPAIYIRIRFPDCELGVIGGFPAQNHSGLELLADLLAANLKLAGVSVDRLNAIGTLNDACLHFTTSEPMKAIRVVYQTLTAHKRWGWAVVHRYDPGEDFYYAMHDPRRPELRTPFDRLQFIKEALAIARARGAQLEPYIIALDQLAGDNAAPLLPPIQPPGDPPPSAENPT